MFVWWTIMTIHQTNLLVRVLVEKFVYSCLWKMCRNRWITGTALGNFRSITECFWNFSIDSNFFIDCMRFYLIILVVIWRIVCLWKLVLLKLNTEEFKSLTELYAGDLDCITHLSINTLYSSHILQLRCKLWSSSVNSETCQRAYPGRSRHNTVNLKVLSLYFHVKKIQLMLELKGTQYILHGLVNDTTKSKQIYWYRNFSFGPSLKELNGFDLETWFQKAVDTCHTFPLKMELCYLFLWFISFGIKSS